MGDPAVVGAASVVVELEAILVGGTRISVGKTITIDGGTGEIFEGEVGGERTVVPEAAVLLGWAAEMGIEIPAKAVPAGAAPAEAEPAVSCPASGAAETTPVGPDEVLRALLVKGFRSPAELATALLSTSDETGAIVDRLVADGLAEVSVGAFKLSGDGKEVAARLIAQDAEAWGLADATAALDAFLALDHRMKETVTAWQMREVDGVQAFNDHSDAAYDAHVLAQLGALHDDARAWLVACAARLPRLRTYLHRLDYAARLVAESDGKYVASPKVDSYHGAWFELHEDLILLAGRTRAEETAAGRA